MDVSQFQQLVSRITADIAGQPLGASLEAHLNSRYGAGSEAYTQLFEACQAGVRDGWLCNREGGGIRFGRVLKASDATHGFSVDVVDMDDIAGPHHAHPNGEIDLVMPLTSGARFDGRPAGWCVYGPGSAHAPTVSQGRALVLYLLPQGAIQFSPATATA
ncbi:DUF4863 family protein [Massilia sp. GCM10023247]|uniref:DUF4863 family protein n=1 Tax=Massilia sp. GCM10023247 TaxID=3252643 RepID=UPI003622D1F5